MGAWGLVTTRPKLVLPTRQVDVEGCVSKHAEENNIRIAPRCSGMVLWSTQTASERKPLKGRFGEDVPRQSSDVMTKPEML